VTIGEHVVVGAGSVVTHDLPDRCVAVGAPARVVIAHNDDTDAWDRIRG
jgi:acetyltransferase-like isoleucine patch superfamily enzyme